MDENQWVSLGIFHPETSGAITHPTYNLELPRTQ